MAEGYHGSSGPIFKRNYNGGGISNYSSFGRGGGGSLFIQNGKTPDREQGNKGKLKDEETAQFKKIPRQGAGAWRSMPMV